MEHIKPNFVWMIIQGDIFEKMPLELYAYLTKLA